MRAPLVALGLMAMMASCPSASALGLGSTGAPGDPTPYASNAIKAHYTLALQPSLDAFDVTIQLTVHELALQGPQGLPAQTIREAGPAVKDAFEARVRATLAEELARSFPDSQPVLGAVGIEYGASDADADLYRPGIQIVADARLPLSTRLLGVPHVSNGPGADWARAFFYSGGSARIERTFMVPAGFDVGLRIQVPGTLELASPGNRGQAAADFSRNNLLGQAPSPMYVRFEVGLRPEQVPSSVAAGPLVRATFRADDATPLWLQAIPFTEGRYVADLDLVIEIPSLPTSLFEQDILPPQLRLEHVSADLIRVASRDGVIGAQELEGYFQATIQQSLRQDFGPQVEITMDSAAFKESLLGAVGEPEVRPIIVHAKARLPVQSDHMLSSSAMVRSVGMLTGTTGGFELNNEGDWRLELILLYPEGAQVSSRDSLHRLEEIHVDGREGFRVYLVQGESTDIHVWGRPGFEASVFIIGLLELTTLLAGAAYLVRWARAQTRARRFPWLRAA